MQRQLRNAIGAIALSLPLSAFAVPFSNMYVFGDSLSDNGNLYSWSGQPNPVTGGIPIPLAPYYTAGRFTNGPNYAELLWNQLGLAGSLIPSFQGGTNYSVGGARSRYHAFDLTPAGLPPSGIPAFQAFSLLGQLNLYNSNHGSTADPNALYLVWGGSNDIQDVLTLAGIGDLTGALSRLGQAVTDVATVVGTLAGEGAEDLLVPNLPDIGLIPAVRALGPTAQAAGTAFSQSFNNALDIALAGLSAPHDLNIFRFDAFDFLQDLVNDPAAFSLSNVTDPCLENFYIAKPLDPSKPVAVCGTPGDYAFWDVVHPTTRVHELLAQGMSAAVPEPSTCALVLAGLGLMGWLARQRR